METKYQLILLGYSAKWKSDLLKIFYKHINELGLSKESILIIEEKNFNNEYKANAPAFCIYFGEPRSEFRNLNLLDILIKDATLILPAATDLKQFGSQIPEQLLNINGFELSSGVDLESLVNCILEGLSLLRISRRLFISYKRDESSSVAIQLYEELEKSGFDVFLDTHSIRPGESFQEELWHRMSDTDVVVLLNTPGFMKSNWTTQELAKANSMSIGILQLIWPEHNLERDAQLSVPFKLESLDFGNLLYRDSDSYLTKLTVKRVTEKVESLRARSLASRQDNLTSEFISSASIVGKSVELQSEKFITLKSSENDDLVVIPTVGIPQAFTYNQSEDLISQIKEKEIKSAYILYDHRNIREKWINHLSWLDNYLPIQTIKIVDAEQWLTKI